MSRQRRRKARALVLVLSLTLLMTLLSGCRGKNNYSDATVSVPSSYASYQVGPFRFRFAPGWKSADYTAFQEQLEAAQQSAGGVNKLALFGRMTSSPTDVGTTNYLDFGYLEMGREVDPEELEDIMDAINEMSSPLKKMGISSDELQRSRIRNYGSTVTALTYSYEVDNQTIKCIVQTGLFPLGSRVYVICYSDFTSKELGRELLEVLSTLEVIE